MKQTKAVTYRSAGVGKHIYPRKPVFIDGTRVQQWYSQEKRFGFVVDDLYKVCTSDQTAVLFDKGVGYEGVPTRELVMAGV